jgi:hypothetical protein
VKRLAEAERIAAVEAVVTKQKAEEEAQARLEEECAAEEQRVQAEKDHIAAEEAAATQALLAQQAAEEAERAWLEAECTDTFIPTVLPRGKKPSQNMWRSYNHNAKMSQWADSRGGDLGTLL